LLVDAAQIIMREKIKFIFFARRLKCCTKRLLGNQPRRSFTKQMRRRLLIFLSRPFRRRLYILVIANFVAADLSVLGALKF